jgi:hypothetical protein
MSYLATIILDFMTTDFERDYDIAVAILSEHKNICGYGEVEDIFALQEPVRSAGWNFSKLFIAGQFIEKIYEVNREEIDKSKGKKFADKFVSWFSIKLNAKGCQAQIKLSTEMKNI